MASNELQHSGVGHKDGGHSGRYPWGSGDNPFQRDTFLQEVRDLKKQGFTEKEVAEKMGIFATKTNGEKVPSISKLRIQISLAEDINRSKLVEKAEELRGEGLSLTAVAKELGLPSESSVRSLLNKESKARMEETYNTVEYLKKRVDESKYGMVDVGKDTNRYLNISPDKLNTALYVMQLQGYEIYGGGVPQVTNKGKQTNLKVLCAPGTEHKDIYDFDKIDTIDDFESHDGGETFDPVWVPPKAVERSRIWIREPKDGGTDLDGTIELRRGVQDIDLGENCNYAQVRIATDNGFYLKGMAVYGRDEEFPKGVDIIFNSSKPNGSKDDKVFKKLKDDPENPFGALIKPGVYDPENPNSDIGGGQSYYIDNKTGEKKLSVINKTRAARDWDEWSKDLPSQFLAKQSYDLCKKQLDLSIAEKEEEFQKYMELSNPTIKKQMMASFAEDCDKAAETLSAAALPGQAYKVLLPVPSLKDNEIYNPSLPNGSKVSLIRFPHGGTFEIAQCIVNNNNKDGQRLIGGDSLDAVGINKNVADKLSGADFDGDTSLVIPSNDSRSKVKISAKESLPGLKGFDNKMEYPYREGMKVLTKENTQREMGQISNLIADMTLKGANDEELARAVRHSMVIIDAAKHKLDYTRSFTDNGIQELRDKYMAHEVVDPNTGEVKISRGASTIITRAKAEADVPKREGSPKINTETGELEYKTASDKKLYYYKRHENAKTGEVTYTKEMHLDKTTQMATTDDAFNLVSDMNNPIEVAYATYANQCKDLANRARLASLTENSGKTVYNKEANKAYAEEVASLESKLHIAEMNAPRERKAQLAANTALKERIEEAKENGQELEKKEIKKYSQNLLTKMRVKYGASGKESRIKITDKEWEAIQAGAISETILKKILNHMDKDELMQRATPRSQSKSMTNAQVSRFKAMRASGYTIAQIAEALNVSSSTVRNYLKEG